MNVLEPDRPQRLSKLYDTALPEIYGYLRRRCQSPQLAEELTSSTFLRAARATATDPTQPISIPWLITVARHQLIDHWRRMAVVDRSLTVLQGGLVEVEEPWDEVLDRSIAHDTLGALSSRHRAVLVLRYLDDLSVPECAEVLELSVHATESLLVRARAAFRAAYEATGGHDD